MRTYLGYVPTSDTVQIPIFQFYTPTSPHNNTQTIPNRRDTPQVCPPRGNRRFQPDIFPLPLGHKCASVALEFRTYLGYVPTTGTTLYTLNFAFRHHHTITRKQSHNRRDTPQVCPPRSNRRFPPDIFPFPFGHKKASKDFSFEALRGR